MKSTMKILAMVAVLLAAATNVAAQTTADATANILTALGCVNTVGDAGALDWGDIVPGTSASVVNITSDGLGTRSLSSGDATLVATDLGNSAEFTLTGVENAVVDLALTSASITLTDGTNTMPAAISLSAATATLTGGSATFYVGGALTVGASQVPGAYSTTFEVTASYE